MLPITPEQPQGVFRGLCLTPSQTLLGASGSPLQLSQAQVPLSLVQMVELWGSGGPHDRSRSVGSPE